MPFVLCFALVAGHVAAQEWKCGQDSPVPDSDQLIRLSGKTVSIENHDIRLTFDRQSRALLAFLHKRTGWNLEQTPGSAGSFRLFALDSLVSKSISYFVSAKMPYCLSKRIITLC